MSSQRKKGIKKTGVTDSWNTDAYGQAVISMRWERTRGLQCVTTARQTCCLISCVPVDNRSGGSLLAQWEGTHGTSPAGLSWDRWHGSAFLSGAIWVQDGRQKDGDSLGGRASCQWLGALYLPYVLRQPPPSHASVTSNSKSWRTFDSILENKKERCFYCIFIFI